MNLSNTPSPEALLKTIRSIAVVGLSDKIWRDSYRVAQYLQRVGYQIYPVNPGVKEVLGLPSYASLLDVPEPVDLVNVFRRSEEVAAIVDDAILIQAQALWLQLGIQDDRSVQKAQSAGLTVVTNQCIMVVHAQVNNSAMNDRACN